MERIIEILLFVLSEYEKSKSPGDIDISGLINRGYTDSEISTAFSWLYDKYYSNGDTFNPPKNNTFRILHDTERVLFTGEAWADLQHMVYLGLISNDDVESMIEKASFSGQFKVDAGHVRNYVANTIFPAKMGQDNPQKVFLGGNESIN